MFLIPFLITVISLSTVLTTIVLIIVYFKHSSNQLALDEEALLQLDPEQQELFYQAKDFLETNNYFRGKLTLSQELAIQERGMSAFEFQKDTMLTNNDLLIVDKTELNFFQNFECSCQTNLPIPISTTTNQSVYYFECKIYALPNPDDTVISLGVSTKPYPWFRLPGRHIHSVSYDSNGYRRHNDPLQSGNPPPFPIVKEGDVVGIGYRTQSGTIFFTRNGKKVSESKIGGHIKNFKIPAQGQIFPTVGANNICSVHVNLGQMGFVFIEANVKKWGYAPLEGNGPAPPIYKKFNSDILLERSEIDESDLSDRENDFPPDFWDQEYEPSENEYENEEHERITLKTLESPPSYDTTIEGSSNIEE
ncbi:ssh4 Protein ssh4 [Candida maltosa Xu316]|uniref:B30.2/SPRY domain-containing protein n=1 Tax=Candida maltosa (strain Xu316) TaxID=1245528 RepID=M3IIH0_CANMX|nr:hypothetical protein G210_3630 [Candida maltosa Xu316]